MIIKITTIAFSIAIILLFILLLWLGKMASFLPIGLLYLIAFVGMFFLHYIGQEILKIRLPIVFPIVFFISLLLLTTSLAWFSGNSIIESVQSIFFNRKDIFTIADPYILGNAIVYVLLLKRVAILF